MFTGITTDVGEVLEVRDGGKDLRHLKIACSYSRASVSIGASISCSGVCLTVVETGERGGRTWFAVDTAAETLKVTTAGRWQPGTKVNLERAAKLGDELGGHIVSGHVDAIVTLSRRVDLSENVARLEMQVPKPLMRFIAPKGSIALDGVSLTVVDVTAESFSAMIIPHTLQSTTLGTAKTGEAMNLEVDTMARYAARFIETR